MKQKGLPVRQAGLAPIYLLIGTLFIGAIFLTPMPYYQNQPICDPPCPSETAICPPCPKSGWYLGDPLWKKIVDYFVSINKPEEYAITITPSPTPFSNPSSAISAETTNWKTYTNTKYGYEVEYPNDWQIQEDTLWETSIKPINNQNDLGFYISVYDKEVGGHGAPGPLVKTTDVTVVGLKTQEKIYQGKCCGDDSPVSTLVSINLIKHADKYYSLEFKFDNKDEKSDQNIINIHNQILSTFKFIP